VGDQPGVFGTPWHYKKDALVNGSEFVGVGALPYLTRTLGVQRGGSPERDLYLEYKTEMHTADGVKPLPPAFGLSGCGLWILNTRGGGVWTPDQAEFAAVQHSWVREEWLRGSLARHWLQMLREDIPALRPAIAAVLGPSQPRGARILAPGEDVLMRFGPVSVGGRLRIEAEGGQDELLLVTRFEVGNESRLLGGPSPAANISGTEVGFVRAGAVATICLRNYGSAEKRVAVTHPGMN
jgi:hypothetical protein